MKNTGIYRLWAAVLLLLTGPLLAQPLKMAVGWSKPPFVMAETATGIELDIVREALAINDYQFFPVFMPQGRTTKALMYDDMHGSLTLPDNFHHDEIYLSQPYITYQNVVVTLAENQLSINSLADLSKISVIAFQNAGRYLGQAYADAILVNSTYTELPNQKAQVAMLFKDRAQAIVLEINIFNFLRQQLPAAEKERPVTFHYLFPANHYRVGFKSRKIRNDFDKGIRALRQSGDYQKIIDSYTSSH